MSKKGILIIPVEITSAAASGGGAGCVGVVFFAALIWVIFFAPRDFIVDLSVTPNYSGSGNTVSGRILNPDEIENMEFLYRVGDHVMAGSPMTLPVVFLLSSPSHTYNNSPSNIRVPKCERLTIIGGPQVVHYTSPPRGYLNDTVWWLVETPNGETGWVLEHYNGRLFARVVSGCS